MKKKEPTPEEELVKRVESDSRKKIKAQKEGSEVMFGLGLFGIVGWSIAIPTLIGIAIGVYLDNNFASDFSWTLTLLFGGIIIGCFNAWHWVNEKSKDD